MPSKKKKYNARFPPARIKKIMQCDEEVGKVAQAVPVIISRALELFVESLLKKAEVVTNARNAKTLTPSHLKQCILAEHRFDFLKELVSTIPDVQGEEESAETPRSSSSNSPFVFPPPSSTATSATVSNAFSETREQQSPIEPHRASISYINDPNLVNYPIPSPGPPTYQPLIVAPQVSIMNPVGANSNPYIPIHHITGTVQPSQPRAEFQYRVQSNVQVTPENGYPGSTLNLSSVSSVTSNRTNPESSRVIVSERDIRTNLKDTHN